MPAFWILFTYLAVVIGNIETGFPPEPPIEPDATIVCPPTHGDSTRWHISCDGKGIADASDPKQLVEVRRMRAGGISDKSPQ